MGCAFLGCIFGPLAYLGGEELKALQIHGRPVKSGGWRVRVELLSAEVQMFPFFGCSGVASPPGHPFGCTGPFAKVWQDMMHLSASDVLRSSEPRDDRRLASTGSCRFGLGMVALEWSLCFPLLVAVADWCLAPKALAAHD